MVSDAIAQSNEERNQDPPLPTTASAPVLHTGAETDANRQQDTHNSYFTLGSRSWTDKIVQTDHNLLFLSCDFKSTSLGPLQEWNFALRMYASMVFSDSRASCIYWGPDKIAFYNDKFAINCGGVHPYLMGNRFADAFPTLTDQIEPIFTQVAASAETIDVNDILLFPIRNGFAEEMYFIGQFIPLRGPSGEVEGFYNTTFDNTTRILHERRRRVVDNIAAIIPGSTEETLSSIMDALRQNPKDITMAMLYTYDELASVTDSNLYLYDTIGIQPDHRCAPTVAKLESDQRGLIPHFRKVKLRSTSLVLSQTDGSLQAIGNILDDIEWCGYGEPARDVVISSISANGTTLGFLVQGTCPRRAYDASTESSIIDTIRQIESKWMASLSVEQARQREKLLEDRAVDSENRLRHMAKSAPLGMCQFAPDDTIKWANDQYYDITGHDRSNLSMHALQEQVALNDNSASLGDFQSFLHGTARSGQEVRLKRRWSPPFIDHSEEEEHHVWVLAVSFPMTENGHLELVMGYFLDISHQKWAENVQARNAANAILAKHRQEEFIDTTSHEMRNPLSAITQLADEIARSLEGSRADTPLALRQIAEQNVDAAQTILTCAAHQKRVIDDVLILSRLESHMLSITPVAERVNNIVHKTVKMFSGEASMNKVKIKTVRDPSYDALKIDTVLVDTSRLTQILINLISNSIKFVSTRSERKISVVYGAQKTRPPRIKTVYGELVWTKPVGERSITLPKLGPAEDLIYLYFCVQDNGTGMTDKEMQRLFLRFSQGSSRTHVTYGGSGLGLYICKQLAEKQGGGIGVASSKGAGTVFAFYVETRAVRSPDEIHERPRSTSPSSKSTKGRPHLTKQMSSAADVSDLPTILDGSPSEDGPSSPKPVQRRGHSVLLVEDNLINQKVLARQLRDADFVVTVANHGQEALQVLESTGHWQQSMLGVTKDLPRSSERKQDIQIVFMDMEMPVMNGLECSREIRRLEKAHHSLKHLPIIAITANVRQEQKDRAIAAGMDRVLSKPFTIADLVLMVDGMFTIPGNDED